MLGNPYLTKPTPEMWVQDISIPFDNAMLKGDSKHDRRLIYFTFNRDYVIAYVWKKLLLPLGIESDENMQWLHGVIDESYKTHVSAENPE